MAGITLTVSLDELQSQLGYADVMAQVLTNCDCHEVALQCWADEVAAHECHALRNVIDALHADIHAEDN